MTAVIPTNWTGDARGLDELVLEAALVALPGRRLRAYVARGLWTVQDLDAPWNAWRVRERDGAFILDEITGE